MAETAEERHNATESAAIPAPSSVALIIGVTGITGLSLAEALRSPSALGSPWTIYGAARRSPPPWFPIAALDLFLPLDVLDPSATRAALSPLAALVTHLFYVPAAASSAKASTEMFSNVLLALSADSPRSSLRHVALQTGSMHYLPPLPLGGRRPPSPAPFREEAPRGAHSLFYYALEDVLQAAAFLSPRLTWTVHRPSVILGASPRSEYNLLLTLAACALICRRERAPLVYPGNEYTWRNPCCDASDAGMLAEQQIWAATEVVNEALNCTNGDVFSWGRLWDVVAGEFGVVHVAPGVEGWEWVERMKAKGDVWEAIVEEEGLVKTRLEEIANFGFVYTMTNMEFEMVSCVGKRQELGFNRRVDTMESVKRWIGRMREINLIPKSKVRFGHLL